MAADFSILTVCTGNIHRSPLAAVLLDTWSGWYLPAPVAEHVHVRSAGFAPPAGAPMGAEVLAVARTLGADGSRHVASRITDELIAASDLVLVASRRQRDEVLARVPSALRVTFTMREAGRIAAGLETPSRRGTVADLVNTVAVMADHRGDHADATGEDVTDPQGRELAAYAQMTREEVVPLANLAAVLFGMPDADVRAYAAAVEDAATLFAGTAGAGPN
jgi:protein-tyrosine phosphatase